MTGRRGAMVPMAASTFAAVALMLVNTSTPVRGQDGVEVVVVPNPNFRPNSCTPRCADVSTRGQWRCDTTEDGSTLCNTFELEDPHECHFHFYDQEELAQCLTTREGEDQLIFIAGGSVMSGLMGGVFPWLGEQYSEDLDFHEWLFDGGAPGWDAEAPKGSLVNIMCAEVVIEEGQGVVSKEGSVTEDISDCASVYAPDPSSRPSVAFGKGVSASLVIEHLHALVAAGRQNATGYFVIGIGSWYGFCANPVNDAWGACDALGEEGAELLAIRDGPVDAMLDFVYTQYSRVGDVLAENFPNIVPVFVHEAEYLYGVGLVVEQMATTYNGLVLNAHGMKLDDNFPGVLMGHPTHITSLLMFQRIVSVACKADEVQGAECEEQIVGSEGCNPYRHPPGEGWWEHYHRGCRVTTYALPNDDAVPTADTDTDVDSLPPEVTEGTTEASQEDQEGRGGVTPAPDTTAATGESEASEDNTLSTSSPEAEEDAAVPTTAPSPPTEARPLPLPEVVDYSRLVLDEEPVPTYMTPVYNSSQAAEESALGLGGSDGGSDSDSGSNVATSSLRGATAAAAGAAAANASASATETVAADAAFEALSSSGSSSSSGPEAYTPWKYTPLKAVSAAFSLLLVLHTLAKARPSQASGSSRQAPQQGGRDRQGVMGMLRQAKADVQSKGISGMSACVRDKAKSLWLGGMDKLNRARGQATRWVRAQALRRGPKLEGSPSHQEEESPPPPPLAPAHGQALAERQEQGQDQGQGQRTAEHQSPKKAKKSVFSPGDRKRDLVAWVRGKSGNSVRGRSEAGSSSSSPSNSNSSGGGGGGGGMRGWGYLSALDGARFLASQHIVGGHYFGTSPQATPRWYIIGWGFTWVPWFMMLSGFVLTYSSLKRQAKEEDKDREAAAAAAAAAQGAEAVSVGQSGATVERLARTMDGAEQHAAAAALPARSQTQTPSSPAAFAAHTAPLGTQQEQQQQEQQQQEEKQEKQQPGQELRASLLFLFARLKSVYPVYLLGLVAAFFVAVKDDRRHQITWLETVASVTLTQAWIPKITENVLQSHCWFLGAIAPLWFLHGRMERFFASLDRRGLVAVMTSLTLVGWLPAIFAYMLPKAEADWYSAHSFGATESWEDIFVVMLKFFPLFYAHLYAYGVGLAYLFRNFRDSPPMVFKYGATVGYFGLLLVFTIRQVQPPSYKLTCRLGALAPLQGLILLGLALGQDPVALLFNLWPFRVAGRYSFAVYVFQFVAFNVWGGYADLGMLTFLLAVAILATRAAKKVLPNHKGDKVFVQRLGGLAVAALCLTSLWGMVPTSVDKDWAVSLGLETPSDGASSEASSAGLDVSGPLSPAFIAYRTGATDTRLNFTTSEPLPVPSSRATTTALAVEADGSTRSRGSSLRGLSLGSSSSSSSSSNEARQYEFAFINPSLLMLEDGSMFVAARRHRMDFDSTPGETLDGSPLVTTTWNSDIVFGQVDPETLAPLNGDHLQVLRFAPSALTQAEKEETEWIPCVLAPVYHAANDTWTKQVVTGPQDPRLFEHNGELKMTFFSTLPNQEGGECPTSGVTIGSPFITEGDLRARTEQDEVVLASQLSHPGGSGSSAPSDVQLFEKNWMAFEIPAAAAAAGGGGGGGAASESPSGLGMIRHLSPFTPLRLDEDSGAIAQEYPAVTTPVLYFSNAMQVELHGGSNALRVDNAFLPDYLLAAFHTLGKDGTYTNYLVTFTAEEPFYPLAISRPLPVVSSDPDKCPVFVSGLTLAGSERILVSYGACDEESRVLELTWADLDVLMEHPTKGGEAEAEGGEGVVGVAAWSALGDGRGAEGAAGAAGEREDDDVNDGFAVLLVLAYFLGGTVLFLVVAVPRLEKWAKDYRRRQEFSLGDGTSKECARAIDRWRRGKAVAPLQRLQPGDDEEGPFSHSLPPAATLRGDVGDEQGSDDRGEGSEPPPESPAGTVETTGSDKSGPSSVPDSGALRPTDLAFFQTPCH